MSRANLEEQKILNELFPDNHFDPDNLELIERFLKAFDIEISFNTEYNLAGWSVLWRHGGGLVCPNVNEQEAKQIIALSCYLDLCGVDVGLTNRLAYWYICGPGLQVPPP